MSIQRLQKAVLWLFYRNPLQAVALNLFGLSLLEYIQRHRCQEMFSSEGAFKPMEEIDTATEEVLKGTYTAQHVDVTTSTVKEIVAANELERVVGHLVSAISSAVVDGNVVANSMKVCVNQLPSGVLDITLFYLERTNG